jgi:hypothetical protein
MNTLTVDYMREGLITRMEHSRFSGPFTKQCGHNLSGKTEALKLRVCQIIRMKFRVIVQSFIDRCKPGTKITIVFVTPRFLVTCGKIPALSDISC